MRGRRAFLALVFVMAHAALPAAASAKSHASDPLPRYPQLEANVAFWRDVFAKYTKQQVVFHDPYHLDLVYAVADVRRTLLRKPKTNVTSRRCSTRIRAAFRRTRTSPSGSVRSAVWATSSAPRSGELVRGCPR